MLGLLGTKAPGAALAWVLFAVAVVVRLYRRSVDGRVAAQVRGMCLAELAGLSRPRATTPGPPGLVIPQLVDEPEQVLP